MCVHVCVRVSMLDKILAASRAQSCRQQGVPKVFVKGTVPLVWCGRRFEVNLEVGPWQEWPEQQHWQWAPGGAGAVREPQGLAPLARASVGCARRGWKLGRGGMVRVVLGEMSTYLLVFFLWGGAKPGSGPQALDLAAWPVGGGSPGGEARPEEDADLPHPLGTELGFGCQTQWLADL